MAVLNNNINFDDYNDPVKSYIDDGFYWDLVPGFRKRADVYVQKNKGRFEDGIFIIDGVDTESFYQVINSQERFSTFDTTSKILLSVFFRRDTTKIEYRRTVYTLIDSLAKIGGFFQLMTAVMKLILPVFIESLFYSRILTKLYQVDSEHEHVYLTDSENYEHDEINEGPDQPPNPSLEAEGGELELSKSKLFPLNNVHNIVSIDFKAIDVKDDEMVASEHPRTAYVKQQKEIRELTDKIESEETNRSHKAGAVLR